MSGATEIERAVRDLNDWRRHVDSDRSRADERDRHVDKRFDQLVANLAEVKRETNDNIKSTNGHLIKLVFVIVTALMAILLKDVVKV